MPRPLTPRASIRCDEGSTLPAARQWGSRLAIWTRAGGDKSRQLPAAGRGVSAEASCRNRPLFGRQVGGCVRTAGRSLDERGSRFYRRGHRCERSHGGGVELSAQCRPSSAVSTVLMRLPSCNHSRRDAPARGRPALEPGWRQLRASGRRREPAGNAAPAAREAATVRPRKPGFFAAGVAHRRADAHKSANAQVSILRAEAPGRRDKPGRAAPPFLRERQPPGWLISSAARDDRQACGATPPYLRRSREAALSHSGDRTVSRRVPWRWSARSGCRSVASLARRAVYEPSADG